jgi:hypothetical protein
MSVKVDPGSAAIAYQFGIEHTRPEISTTAIRAIRFSGKSRMDPVATAHNASARTPCGLEAQDKREHKRADPPILAQYTRALTTVTVPANCMIENGLNLQPRKCLGYLTPHEVSHNLDLLQLLRFTVECKLFFIFRVETSVDKGPCSRSRWAPLDAAKSPAWPAPARYQPPHEFHRLPSGRRRGGDWHQRALRFHAPVRCDDPRQDRPGTPLPRAGG